MKVSYLKFVEWNEADGLFVGYCPDLFIGGICHGKSEQRVYAQLCRAVEGELKERRARSNPLPRREAVVAITLTV